MSGQERKVRLRLAGQRFGRLIVMKEAVSVARETRWECECDCGVSGVIVKTKNLRNGTTTSCGCRLEELFEERRHSAREIQERFWEKVDRSQLSPGGCWPWLASCYESGYGVFRIGSKADNTARNVTASRFAYELTFGLLADDLEACHRCDNPPCCNPDHLFSGTHQDNMDDMTAKGRRRGPIVPMMTFQSGEAHRGAKLTAAQVREIREQAANGASRTSLASLHRVSVGCIRKIVLRLAWQTIDPAEAA